MRNSLEKSKTAFAVVGRVAEGKGVHVIQESSPTHYTELQAEQDELARIWCLYP